MITKTPIGCAWLENCIMIDVTSWNQELKDFIISEMNRVKGNIKVICVIESDNSISQYEINDQLTALIPIPTAQRERSALNQVKGYGSWYKEKVTVQRSDKLTVNEKEELCDILEKNSLHGLPLTANENARASTLRGKRDR